VARWVYFDASALIKRYSQETGTAVVNAIFRDIPHRRMICSVLGLPEVISILVRKSNDRRNHPQSGDRAPPSSPLDLR
jgi:predicted nucleic acid-binding protein